MKCPYCGSENIQYCTKTSGGGFSFFDSCCGYILLGPLGLLCGACGSGTSTKEFWICQNCGRKFSNTKAKITEETKIKNERKAEEKYRSYRHDLKLQGIDEERYSEILKEHKTALQSKKEAEENYNRVLTELTQSVDTITQKHAKNVSSKNFFTIVFLEIIVGLILSSFIAPLGIAMIAVGVILWIVRSKKEQKSKNVLKTYRPEFLEAEKMLEQAKAEEKELSEKAMKIEYIKNYEQQNPK